MFIPGTLLEVVYIVEITGNYLLHALCTGGALACIIFILVALLYQTVAFIGSAAAAVSTLQRFAGLGKVNMKLDKTDQTEIKQKYYQSGNNSQRG